MKLKRIIINVGNVIAILLMFSPIIIAAYYYQIGDFSWLLLLLSICYDAYMYSLVIFNERMKENKSLYLKVTNGKTIESNTEEKKSKWYQVICVNILNDYFDDNINK